MADVVIGQDSETGETVYLSEEGRRLSTYVIGTIGTGKSALLEQIARQDMESGDGLCFLDPHEDSAENLLRYVPEHRRQDVIFWDPTDRNLPFGLNPFSCLNSDDVDSKASNFIAALESLAEFTEAFANAPRMKSILRHLALTFLLNQGSTLAETPRFLSSQSYRAQFYEAIPPEYVNVRDFWERFDRRSEREQRELSDSSLNKLERFQIDRTMRGIFGQPDHSIDFRQVMDEGKIVIVKLSSHKLGVDNAAFIGAFIVWEIFQAALSRADVPEAFRRQFHLLADEFQTYMTTAFPQLIEQVRKFSVDVTVAHQRRDQLPAGSRNAPLVAGNKIVFAVSGTDAVELGREFKINVPEPPVMGQRPKYGYATRPLEHLAQHGHEESHVVSRYKSIRSNLDDIFGLVLLTYKQREKIELTLKLGYPPLIYEYPVTSTDYQLLQSRQVRLEEIINDALYAQMVAPSDKERIRTLKIKRAVIEAELADMFANILDPITKLRFDLVRGAYEMYESRQKIIDALRDRKIAYGDMTDDEAWEWWAEETIKIDREEEPTPARSQLGFQNRHGGNGGTLEEWEVAFALYKAQDSIRGKTSVLGFYLFRHPCLVPTGQLEPILNNPRLYSDVGAEIANTLATLPRFTARCKLIHHGHAQEHTILTFDHPALESGAISRAETIKQDSRHRYGKERATVEAQIGHRLRAITQTSDATVRQAKPEADAFWFKDE